MHGRAAATRSPRSAPDVLWVVVLFLLPMFVGLAIFTWLPLARRGPQQHAPLQPAEP